MASKFLDLNSGLPNLWERVKQLVKNHNGDVDAHNGATLPATETKAGIVSTKEQTFCGQKTFIDGIKVGSKPTIIFSDSDRAKISYDLLSVNLYATGITDNMSISGSQITFSPSFGNEYAIFHSGMNIPASNISSGTIASLVSANASSQAENTAQLRNISVTTDEVTEGTTELAAGQILVVVEE